MRMGGGDFRFIRLGSIPTGHQAANLEYTSGLALPYEEGGEPINLGAVITATGGRIWDDFQHIMDDALPQLLDFLREIPSPEAQLEHLRYKGKFDWTAEFVRAEMGIEQIERLLRPTLSN